MASAGTGTATGRLTCPASTRPQFDLLASAAHPYPPTKLSFQPASLSSSPPSTPRYAPTSRAAKRASWRGSAGEGGGDEGGSGSDGWADRELLATTADCLRVWECYREEDRSSAYVGRREGAPLPFGLREKSVLAHVSARKSKWERDAGQHDRRQAMDLAACASRRPQRSCAVTVAVCWPLASSALLTDGLLLQSKSSSSPPAPLTSFSWNAPTPSLIVTSSIDTTCTIWDLPTRTALTQLIAHDREVYDVDWCPGSSDVFASVGADGSVRVFDLRSLEHSTIIYETGAPAGPGGNAGSRPGTSASQRSSAAVMPSSLLRIAFNPWDANYLATFAADASAISILDVRAPGSPILELRGHSAAVNAVAWGPPGQGASKGMICTAGDDAQCLVYDLASSTLRSASAQGRRSRNGAGPSPAPSSAMSTYSPSPAPSSDARGVAAETPILAYESSEMINNVAWWRPNENRKSNGEWDDYAKGDATRSADWLALTSGRNVRALRV
jgi:WD repeat-containing protein 68